MRAFPRGSAPRFPPSGKPCQLGHQRHTQEFSRCPASRRQSCCHGWGPVPIVLWSPLAPALSEHCQRHSQRLVCPDEVVVRSPPLQVRQEIRCLLGTRPGPPDQSCYTLPDRQVHSLNKRGVELAREPEGPKGRL